MKILTCTCTRFSLPSSTVLFRASCLQKLIGCFIGVCKHFIRLSFAHSYSNFIEESRDFIFRGLCCLLPVRGSVCPPIAARQRDLHFDKEENRPFNVGALTEYSSWPLPLSHTETEYCSSQSYLTTGGLPPICSSWRQTHGDSRPAILFPKWTLAFIVLT